MKLTKLVAVSSLLLGAVVANAQQNPISVTISARITTQNTNTTDIRGVTTTPAPKVRLISNNDVLKRTAADMGTTFPRGSHIVAVNGGFAIIQGTNLIADISNIIRLDSGNNSITSGRQNDTNGLASTSITKLSIGRLTFDDTSINTTNGLSFYIQGALTTTTVDGRPSNNGVYTETVFASMPSAAGEGSNGIGSGDEKPIIVTGSLSASGTGKQTLAP